MAKHKESVPAGVAIGCDASRWSRVRGARRHFPPLQPRPVTVGYFLLTTMSTRILLRAVGKARLSPPVTTATRAYATATPRPTARTTYASRTATRTPAARASTTTEKSSSAATPNDVDVPPEAYSAQPESVPSSSALQDVSVPLTTGALSSFVPVEFAESAAISGSPADPNAPDWSKSYFGLSTQPFPREVAETLLAPVDPMDVEIKPGTL